MYILSICGISFIVALHPFSAYTILRMGFLSAFLVLLSAGALLYLYRTGVSTFQASLSHVGWLARASATHARITEVYRFTRYPLRQLHRRCYNSFTKHYYYTNNYDHYN